ncbi:MAG: S41 family peptidase [Terracidiphilus sp.]
MRNSPLFLKTPTIPSWRSYGRVFRYGSLWLMIFCPAKICWPQQITPIQRDQAQDMLKDVAKDVKENYYDPHLHGVDWDAKVREAKKKIDNADSLNRALSAIAGVFDSLDDPQTRFLPPPRPYVHDYGFHMQMIGDHCYVTRVRPFSDAAAKGLKPGDEIKTINGYTPTRESFWKITNLLWILRPQQNLLLNLRSLDGGERQINVIPQFRQLPKVKDLDAMNRFDFYREWLDREQSMGVRYANRDYDLLIIKLQTFIPFSSETDDIVSKTQGYKSVIFDLRGDPGGREEMVQSLLGAVFEHKVGIGKRVGRSKTIPMETAHHFHRFTGKLAVLVDSQSAGASEIFARTIQLEKRGVVIGDRTKGAVMEAEFYPHITDGTTEDSILVYGAEVTDADIIMSDGLSLEHIGVEPDLKVLPTASDLASGRDPALAKAAELLNVAMSPEAAGKLFPYEWPKD